MAIQLMKLRQVPDDELAEILDLLDAHDVDYYQTTAGNWGISMPALWLRDEARFPEVRTLLDDYATQRQQQVREHYRQQSEAGNKRTMFAMLRENPLRYIGALVLIAGLLYFSLVPFITLIGQD
jgi:hypothetical protein